VKSQIIDGKVISAQVRSEISVDVSKLKNDHNIIPKLAVILIGDDAASQVYVRNKQKSALSIGMHAEDYKFSTSDTTESVINLINDLNNDPYINGILVQLPLPENFNKEKIIYSIDPLKDVDGLHPFNVGLVSLGQPRFIPATPFGISEMLNRTNINVEGSNIVIIGRSNIVGIPLGNLFVQKMKNFNSTITICHSRTKNISEYTKNADIVMAAIGSANFLTLDMVKENSVIIDVGINRVEDNSKKSGFRLVGDVDYQSMIGFVKAITPVPGGVGPMTIAMLLKNTYKAAIIQNRK
jgi:methylenetetrahydrofolate dehydrogenase (NADP+)/methenyltetrahydrofolate cyclohydrolase|tara:strand:- start:1043 stop:1930 length:888 start_codon:yes stop_codon:yes gene_type:complete